ncbi:arginine deiminase family protein [Mycobacterium lepromatosis]
MPRKAIGIDKMLVIDTELDPVIAELEQWNDVDNTLTLTTCVVASYERRT